VTPLSSAVAQAEPQNARAAPISSAAPTAPCARDDRVDAEGAPGAAGGAAEDVVVSGAQEPPSE